MGSECCPVRDGSVCVETQPVMQCAWGLGSKVMGSILPEQAICGDRPIGHGSR